MDNLKFIVPLTAFLLAACSTPRVDQGVCLKGQFAVDSAGNVSYPCGYAPAISKTPIPDPIIDTKGVDMATYRSDLNDCKSYARSINPALEAFYEALAGAAVGAATGALVGNGYGDAGAGAGYGAGLGAIGAGVSGGGVAVNTRELVVKRCMMGRGYSVLN